MSNHDSTTIVDLVASSATTPPVHEKKRRKKKRRDESDDAHSLSSEVNTKSTLKKGITIGAILLLLKHWLRTAVAAGYGVSLLIHAVALLVMSFAMFSNLEFDTAIQSAISDAEESSLFDDVIDLQMDMPMGDVSFEKTLQSAMDVEQADWAENPITTGIEDLIESLFEKDGDKGLGGSGFLAPKNSRVFKKGSFSAWTIPNDPEPGQNYVIVIVVKLPSRVKRYRATDLSGIVIGTDGYRQPIPGPTYSRGKVYLPMKDKMVQLKIVVPGGASRVRDVIDIRSTMLKEKQRIELEF